MKTILLFCVLSLSLNLYAQHAIVSTAHDFSERYGWKTTGKICTVCHSPSNAFNKQDAPLWNRRLSVASFTPYTSGTMDAKPGQPSSVSLLCLSCHDGVTAMDNFSPVVPVPVFMTGPAVLGTDLSNDHPVSFVYNSALATMDGELFDPSKAPSGLGSTIEEDMLTGHGTGNKTLECTSCHNPHDNAFGKFMIMPNTNSELCLTCHNK